jgi:hypothetical protein
MLILLLILSLRWISTRLARLWRRMQSPRPVQTQT